MEKLTEFMASRGLSQQAFAALVGIQQGTVSHWLTGRYSPSAELARQVEQRTGGALRASDLRPDLFGDGAAA